MPTWSGILAELRQEQQRNPAVLPFDAVRRRHLVRLNQLTGRPAILYATRWTDQSAAPPEAISITEEDIQGLMEVVHGIPGPSLDLILHSPGGSLEPTEAIVAYLRSRFDDIRVVIPQGAMSAATMIACAANSILMGKHSYLGPVDPQFILATPLGQRTVSAWAVMDQFKLAKKQSDENPKNLGPWLPMLNQYGPDLLVKSDQAVKLSTALVSEWLTKYMFAGQEGAAEKAAEIARWLVDHSVHKSHARHLMRQQLEDKGLNIQALEENDELQDAFLSVFHAATHTMMGAGAMKIIENHLGKAFIKSVQMPIQLPIQIPMPRPPQPGPPRVQ